MARIIICATIYHLKILGFSFYTNVYWVHFGILKQEDEYGSIRIETRSHKNGRISLRRFQIFFASTKTDRSSVKNDTGRDEIFIRLFSTVGVNRLIKS